MYHSGTAKFLQHGPCRFRHTLLPANKVIHCVLVPSCSCCREAVNVVRCLDQRERWRSISYILLEWIIQSLSHAAVNHTPKRGLLRCAQERSDPRGAGYLSTPTDQSLPANRLTPSPSTFHSSALVWKGMCDHVYVCVHEVPCGGEPPFRP